jgi:protein O-mannosyl-transferase
MPGRPAWSIKAHCIPILILLIALSGTWLAYSQGLSSAPHIDDQQNLASLAQVEDFASASHFIGAGTAGPLGRPLALASFAAQFYAWPDATEVFLRGNVLIHLLNGLFLAWLFYLIGHARGHDHKRAGFAAACAAGLWLLLPLSISTNLVVIQRMTSLATLFVLAGGVAYFYARMLVDERPLPGLAAMSLALILGGSLATLSKENGVLLVVFILVVEATLLRRPPAINKTLWRVWIAAALVLPFLLLSAYLATRLSYSPVELLRRGFTGPERLITQAGILWEYLGLALLPNPAALAPFHDDYALQAKLLTVQSMGAIAAWCLAIVLAIALRHRSGLPLFALAWYLGGHMLESTSLPLELYFQHRNYLPMAGPVYAIVAAACAIPQPQRRRLALGGLGAYGVALGCVLFSICSLWGHPALASEMWYIHKPDSIRAAQYIAGQLQRDGDPHTALRVLKRKTESHPEETSVQLQYLSLSCALRPEIDHSEDVARIGENLINARFSFGVVDGLMSLRTLAAQNACPGVDLGRVYQLAEAAVKNPSFRVHAVNRHNLHVLMALTVIDLGDLDLAVRQLETAQTAYYSLSTLRFTVRLLRSAGLDDVAAELVEEAKTHRPENLLRVLAWDRELDQLRQELRRN